MNKIISCQTTINILPKNNSYRKNQHIDLRIFLSIDKMKNKKTIISQTNKKTTSCETIIDILATMIKIKRIFIQIYVSQESIIQLP